MQSNVTVSCVKSGLARDTNDALKFAIFADPTREGPDIQGKFRVLAECCQGTCHARNEDSNWNVNLRCAAAAKVAKVKVPRQDSAPLTGEG